jgi:hypothetical protein
MSGIVVVSGNPRPGSRTSTLASIRAAIVDEYTAAHAGIHSPRTAVR